MTQGQAREMSFDPSHDSYRCHGNKWCMGKREMTNDTGSEKGVGSVAEECGAVL
jgi:hypothetical protein